VNARQHLYGYLALLAVVTVAWLSTGLLAIGAARNAERNGEKLARLDRQTTRELRRSDYNICSRGNRLRAWLHIHYPSGDKATVGIPVVDCAPNLNGRPAVPLTPAEQDLYVDQFARSLEDGRR
jgi:hypothetical protein